MLSAFVMLVKNDWCSWLAIGEREWLRFVVSIASRRDIIFLMHNLKGRIDIWCKFSWNVKMLVHGKTSKKKFSIEEMPGPAIPWENFILLPRSKNLINQGLTIRNSNDDISVVSSILVLCNTFVLVSRNTHQYCIQCAKLLFALNDYIVCKRSN